MKKMNEIWENNFSELDKKSYVENVLFKKINYDLSIIVPVFNAEKYLTKCLESIVNQSTNYSYEVILIDDGSKDNSSAICMNYEKKYEFINYYFQENKGASAARNYGVLLSKGKYISFVDSDDYISNSFVEIMLNEILNKKGDFIKCGYNEFDSHTNKIVKKVYLKNKEYSGNESYTRNLKGHACMCVFDRKILEKIKFPEGYWFEDIIVKFLLFPQCKKIITISDPLYYYRVNISSTSNNMMSKRNVKCISQLYLIIDCTISYKKLIDKYDNCFYKNLFYESFSMLWLRTRYLDKNIRKDIFYELCNFYTNIFINEKNCQKFMLKNYILRNKRFVFWEVVSIINYIFVR